MFRIAASFERWSFAVNDLAPADHQVKSQQLFAALEIRRERKRERRMSACITGLKAFRGETLFFFSPGKHQVNGKFCYISDVYPWLVRPF